MGRRARRRASGCGDAAGDGALRRDIGRRAATAPTKTLRLAHGRADLHARAVARPVARALEAADAHVLADAVADARARADVVSADDALAAHRVVRRIEAKTGRRVSSSMAKVWAPHAELPNLLRSDRIALVFRRMPPSERVPFAWTAPFAEL